MEQPSSQESNLNAFTDHAEYAKALFNLSPDGMFLMDVQGVIIDGNKRTEEILGLKKETLIGKNLFEINVLTKESRLYALKRMQAVFKGAPSETLELKLNHADGKQIIIEAKAHAFSKNDKTYFIGTLHDITLRKQQENKLKESEAKFKYLADFTFDWEYWINPEGEYIYNSPSCEQTTGYLPSAFEENPELLIDITHSDFKEAVKKHLTVELTDTSMHSMEFQIIKPNGEVVWIEHSCQPIYSPEGKYLGKRGVNKNISRKKKVYEALEESNLRFRNLSQLTFEGILIHKDGIIKDVNLAFEKLSGYNRDEIIDTNLNTAINTEHSTKAVRKNISKNYAKPYETTLQKKDGTIIDIEIEAKNYTLQGEEFRVAAVRDITEKKKTASTLNFLNKALKNSREVVFTLDKNGVFNYINPEFTKLYGYTEEEIIGKETPRILKSQHTSDEEYDIIWEKLLLKENLVTSFINKSKKGQLIDIETSADPILDENGNIIGFLALQHDITERKKRELRQAVISSIANKVIEDIEFEDLIKFIQSELHKLIDASNFYYANYIEGSKTFSIPYFSDKNIYRECIPIKGSLTGYLIEQKKSILLNPQSFEELKEKLNLNQTGKPAKQWLGVPLLKNDSVIGAFVVQSYTNEHSYTTEDQKTLEIIASQISLAIERKQNEEHLRIALTKAQESDRLKSTFLATMSHELRTPLNAIIGFSDLVEDDRPKEEIINFCRTINRSGNHLLGIVNEIFDFTLIETGEIKLSYNEYSLSSILKDVFLVIQEEQTTLLKQDIDLSYHIPEKYQNLKIKTDNQRLQQVLLNLLKNALKFTDSGSIKYGFNVLTKEKKHSLQFYVEDTGIGIAKDKQEIIFDVFRQADDSHTRKHDGVGLGLSISRKILAMMRGNIWLKSNVGTGSTFYFDLPCTMDIEESKADKKLVSSKESTDYKNRTILIAEDEETNFSLLEYMLAPLKMKIIWAKDGQEAFDLFLENPSIDLILMDIRMPKMNGLEVTKKIKKIKPNLPIIAQTAYAISGDKELALYAGCDDYLSKPINKISLRQVVNKYLN